MKTKLIAVYLMHERKQGTIYNYIQLVYVIFRLNTLSGVFEVLELCRL